LAICLSAFGNGPAVEGGVVAIGIEKDGRVTGCNRVSPEKVQALEFMGRDNCHDGRFVTRRLSVKNERGDDDFIILARVSYVEDRLVELTNGEAYCRESDRSRRLSDSEKAEIRINKGERAFELEPCSLTFPDDFRESEIERFARQIRANRESSEPVSDIGILQATRLGKVKQNRFVPNNVCAIMFAKDPQEVFPGAYIHFLRYRGTEERPGTRFDVIKDRIIAGTILEVIRDTATTLDANLREFTTRRGGKFFSMPEYPHDAWYELIVNACVHRSYHSKTQPIFVKMFDDRLVVESPGAFMPSVTPDNFSTNRETRSLCSCCGSLGKLSASAKAPHELKREMSEAHLPAAVFVGKTHSVVATLYNDIANRQNSLDSEAYKVLGEAVSFSLDPDERKIINFVVENARINVSDALRILSTTYWHTAKAKLQRLVTRGVLEFVSAKARDPNSFYQLHKGKPPSA
jgi:ATP-dependent DNA helicase RecG